MSSMTAGWRLSMAQPLLSLPERSDGVFIGVVTEFAVAQNEGGAVGAGEFARGAPDNGHDGVQVAGQGQFLDGGDEPRHAAAKALQAQLLLFGAHGGD